MISGSQPATAAAGDEERGETSPARLAGLETLVSALYETSGAARFDLPAAEFSNILNQIAAKYLPLEAGQAAVRELISKLHVEELALARACAAGHDRAWEVFLTRYRECLYQSAAAIAKDEALGRELADSLYADLYGSDSRAGGRVSKLTSYTGIGSLAGWLSTVFAQAHVNRLRRESRWAPLEEENDDDPRLAVPPAVTPIAVDRRLEHATGEALASLSPEDGFILASYFLDGQTLADIARALQLHESTVSRRVEKIAARLRKKIRDALLSRGMSRAQAEEALEADVRDLQVNVRARLRESVQETPAGAFSKQRESPVSPLAANPRGK
jgi:RNA polymerase sigma-70 factor (ECF subfamily)